MLRLLATTAGLALATSLQAQPLPDTDALSAQLARSLPGHWQVNVFVIVTTTQAGDAMRPRVYVRFQAGTAPAADLHLESGSEGSFVVLTRTTVEEGSDALQAALRANTLANPVATLEQCRDRAI